MAKTAKKLKPRSSGKDDVITGIRVREARVAKHLSQAQLGDELGVSFQQIQKYEKGVNRISNRRIVAICKTLDIDPNYLVGWNSTTKINVDLHTDIFVLSNELGKLDARIRASMLSMARSMVGHGFTSEE